MPQPYNNKKKEATQSLPMEVSKKKKIRNEAGSRGVKEGRKDLKFKFSSSTFSIPWDGKNPFLIEKSWRRRQQRQRRGHDEMKEKLSDVFQWVLCFPFLTSSSVSAPSHLMSTHCLLLPPETSRAFEQSSSCCGRETFFPCSSLELDLTRRGKVSAWECKTISFLAFVCDEKVSMALFSSRLHRKMISHKSARANSHLPRTLEFEKSRWEWFKMKFEIAFCFSYANIVFVFVVVSCLRVVENDF